MRSKESILFTHNLLRTLLFSIIPILFFLQVARATEVIKRIPLFVSSTPSRAIVMTLTDEGHYWFSECLIFGTVTQPYEELETQWQEPDSSCTKLSRDEFLMTDQKTLQNIELRFQAIFKFQMEAKARNPIYQIVLGGGLLALTVPLASLMERRFGTLLSTIFSYPLMLPGILLVFDGIDEYKSWCSKDGIEPQQSFLESGALQIGCKQIYEVVRQALIDAIEAQRPQ